MRFEVWAPAATEVEAEVDGSCHGLTPIPPAADGAGGGSWAVDVADAGPGSRYGFSVDGGPFRPDPRSASQPEGVDGPSEVVDHDGFPWTDDGWTGFDLSSAVIEEIHIGTFSEAGTFDGAIDHLDALVDLGIDAVEVLPIAEFSGDRGWGYDGVDLYAPHHAYGGPAGFARFVDACHARGLGVVLDVVYNHLGPAGNHLATYGPYFTDHHVTSWGPGVNVDGPGSDEVRRWIIDNARHWFVHHHVDGLRLDAVRAISDDSAVHVLEALADATDALEAELGRRLWLIAESDRNDPRYVRPIEDGGLGLDSAWADEWHHALHAVLTGETDGYYEDFGTLADLALGLRQAWVYAGRYSRHRRRHHGRDARGLDGRHFVVSAQNHDQIGNRAAGERLSHLVSPGRQRIAAALLLTSPFVPMLFQGESWGASTPFLYFTDHPDPELGRAVTEGRRREFASFGWDPATVPDPQSPATHARSVLRWGERTREPHAGLLEWHRALIALRREVPELTAGRWQDVVVGVDRLRDVLRFRNGPVQVVANLGGEPAEVRPAGRVVVGFGLTGEGSDRRLQPDGCVVWSGAVP